MSLTAFYQYMTACLKTGYTIIISKVINLIKVQVIINLMHALNFNHLIQLANLLLEDSNILLTLYSWKPSLKMGLLNL